VVPKVNLGLVEQHPTAWATVAFIEWAAKSAP